VLRRRHDRRRAGHRCVRDHRPAARSRAGGSRSHGARHDPVRPRSPGGHGARGYYVFDDGSTTIRDFLAGLVEAHGLTLPEASIPGPVAASLARALDLAWRLTRRAGEPPITRLLVELNRYPFLISDARARQELGYQPVITRQQGMQRVQYAARSTVQPG
jgi:nucleoside-diphosphate-sugar epimerase